MARITHGPTRVWFVPEKGEPAGPFLILNEVRTFGMGHMDEHIEITMVRDGPPAAPNHHVQEDTMRERAVSTKEQVEVREDPSSTAPKREVVDQIPADGTADQGDTITIFVSIYEEPVVTPPPTETPLPSETPTTPLPTTPLPTETTTATPRRR